MEKNPVRKLAVILHADVAGSTKLVHRNESLAHTRIQDTFRRFSEVIVAFGGAETNPKMEAFQMLPASSPERGAQDVST